MKVIVKWFNEEKEYGFIASEDGKNVFKLLKENEEVEFDVFKGGRGLEAENII